MADSSILQEALAAGEFLALQSDRILYGEGVPRGDGSKVLVLPGLMGNDLYLATIRRWLKRIGYEPIASDLWLNAGCANRMAGEVSQKLAKILNKNERLAIIGHSRGGMLGKSLATRLGRQVSHLILVGSPVGGLLSLGARRMSTYSQAMEKGSAAQQWVFNAGRAANRFLDPDCDAPSCDCDYYQNLFASLDEGTQVSAIYSTDDAIVPAISASMPYGQNQPVRGSHSGLMFNREVYVHIAAALAQRPAL